MNTSLARFLMLTTLCCVLTSATDARAQFGESRIERPFNRPTISPYLNLFRNGGGTPILNYYGLVRPQQQFYQQADDLRQGVYINPAAKYQSPNLRNDQQRTNGSVGYVMGMTGHTTAFRVPRRTQAGGIGNAGAGLNSGEQTGINGSGSQFGTGSSSGHMSGFSYGPAYGPNRQN